MSLTVVVTGANRGIGLEFCRYYASKGNRVIGVCREISADLNALNVHVVEHVDITKEDDLALLRQYLQGFSIDILINNAGILRREIFSDLDFAEISSQYEVNAIGPLRVTQMLLGQLAVNAKVALISSRMGSIADNTSGGYYGYRMSKAALNAAGKSLAHDLKKLNIAVAILHPGYVNTEMTNHTGDVSAVTAVKGLVNRIKELNMDNSGTFWHANGEILPW